jgi:hypothetical protein
MNPDGSDRKTIVTGCHLPGRYRRRCGGWPHLLDQHGRAQPVLARFSSPKDQHCVEAKIGAQSDSVQFPRSLLWAAVRS